MRHAMPVLFFTLAAAAGPASAAQLIVDGSWNNRTFGSVSRFDPTLGTLTGVTVMLDATTGGGWSQMSFGGYTVDGSMSGVLGLNIGSVAYAGTSRGTGNGDFWINAGGSAVRQVAAGEFAPFLGTGALMITPAGGTQARFAFTDVSGMGGVMRAQQSSMISANVRVIYDYASAAVTAVPEPASWAMMIGGFGLVGLAVRRRRSHGAIRATSA